MSSLEDRMKNDCTMVVGVEKHEVLTKHKSPHFGFSKSEEHMILDKVKTLVNQSYKILCIRQTIHCVWELERG